MKFQFKVRQLSGRWTTIPITLRIWSMRPEILLETYIQQHRRAVETIVVTTREVFSQGRVQKALGEEGLLPSNSQPRASERCHWKRAQQNWSENQWSQIWTNLSSHNWQKTRTFPCWAPCKRRMYLASSKRVTDWRKTKTEFATWRQFSRCVIDFRLTSQAGKSMVGSFWSLFHLTKALCHREETRFHTILLVHEVQVFRLQKFRHQGSKVTTSPLNFKSLTIRAWHP